MTSKAKFGCFLGSARSLTDIRQSKKSALHVYTLRPCYPTRWWQFHHFCEVIVRFSFCFLLGHLEQNIPKAVWTTYFVMFTTDNAGQVVCPRNCNACCVGKSQMANDNFARQYSSKSGTHATKSIFRQLALPRASQKEPQRANLQVSTSHVTVQ